MELWTNFVDRILSMIIDIGVRVLGFQLLPGLHMYTIFFIGLVITIITALLRGSDD